MWWLARTLFRYSLVAFIWLVSLVAVTTNALLMDTISDGLSNVFGVSTPYAQQKNMSLRQKTAIKKTRAQSHKVASKMVIRNVLDAGSVLIPIGGAVVGLGFAAADVYAACELIDIQNELSDTLQIPNDTSVVDELCFDAVSHIESLPDLPDLSDPQWQAPAALTKSRDKIAEWLCNATDNC